MERLTAKNYRSFLESYVSIYDNNELQEQEKEQENIQEFLQVIDELVEDGYDLSEYTYDELYEYYITEGVGNVLNQDVDIFDVIKVHLFDEGYAETEEAALKIMANMSEEWKESILEAYLPWDFSRGNRPSPRDLSARAQSRQQNSGTPVGQVRAQQIGDVRANMRTGINKVADKLGTPPGKEGTAPGTQRHARSAMTVGGTAGGKTYLPLPGGPKPSGLPSARIPSTPALRAANQAAQSRRGGSSSLEQIKAISGKYRLGQDALRQNYQVGGGRGYGSANIRLAD